MMAAMKRPPGLVTLSRRDFCSVLGLASAAGVVISCSSDSSGTTPDAAKAQPDAGTCATGTDVGAPASFQMNTPVYNAAGRFFVVRDANGLYAVSARCTHQGVAVVTSGSSFRCPAHGATFTFDGAVTGGPTFTPLPHLSMCLLANGHVGVSANVTVPATTRLKV
jgi:cytochrome b6-f complex iron-sulfur subunit